MTCFAESGVKSVLLAVSELSMMLFDSRHGYCRGIFVREFSLCVALIVILVIIGATTFCYKHVNRSKYPNIITLSNKEVQCYIHLSSNNMLTIVVSKWTESTTLLMIIVKTKMDKDYYQLFSLKHSICHRQIECLGEKNC